MEMSILVFTSIYDVPASKEATLYQERVYHGRTATVPGPQRIRCPWQFLISDFLSLISSFLVFILVSKPGIYMFSTVFEGLISYLSLETRGQLVKVSVEREIRLPELVMHQTVMAGNCLKKIHFVMN